jgi:hypothetical protein
MTRSMLAGITDYRHQTLKDILSDLQKWVNELEQVTSIMNENIEKLEGVGYWDEVSDDFKSTIYYSLKFYKTSVEEIKSMLLEFGKEVRKDHIVRIKRLSEVAAELDRDFGKAWYQHYGKKEYGKGEFKLVEKLYQEGRGMAIDMWDLSNLAERLEDFVGSKSDNINGVKKRFAWLILQPNFQGIGIDLKKIKGLRRFFKEENHEAD